MEYKADKRTGGQASVDRNRVTLAPKGENEMRVASKQQQQETWRNEPARRPLCSIQSDAPATEIASCNSAGA